MARTAREGLAQLWSRGLPTDLAQPTDLGWTIPRPGGGVEEIPVTVDPDHPDLPDATELAGWLMDAEAALPFSSHLLLETVAALRDAQYPILGGTGPVADRPDWQLVVLREVVRGRPLTEALEAAAAHGITFEMLPALPIEGTLWRVGNVECAAGTGALVVGMEGDEIKLRALLTGEDADRQLRAMGAWLASHPEQAGRIAVSERTSQLSAILVPLLRTAMEDGPDAFRPRPGDVEAVFHPQIQPAMQRYTDEIWSGKGPRLKVDPSQTEIQIEAAPVRALRAGAPFTQDFPLAYRRFSASLMSDDRTWVTWMHHAPGHDKGTRYDGLVWVDDHWAWFPKPWRGLKYAQRP